MTKKPAEHEPDEKSEEYQRFEALARGLVGVSKDELDAALKEDKKRKKWSRASTKPATASQ